MFYAALNDTRETFTGGLRDVTFDITPSALQPGDYTLTLKGFLSPGWLGRLAAALALHRIGIVNGQAEKITAYAWQASFKLKAARPTCDPVSLDYVALANTEPSHQALAPIVLRDLKIEPCSRHQGSLYIEIRGVDRLGFLGDLLDFFSMRCLFPVKLTVETLGETAADRFWLRGVGGSVPSDLVVQAIRENLEKFVTQDLSYI
ncbi:hypothetical protein GMLC_33520 [Geomonas limicola]|uniref:ACT domain-containing protein n=1 Tax=Geomonas limicola TaxID=2740186 RepID=A0A6V8NDX8_9BACT|nr:hypothetical protein [Geomonas limicola]GFO69773.1 hypothetical protein GMLC_33520 [Geomonas limicola]